jgi:hypothetical protein
MSDKPYFVTEDSPLRLRKLLIRNPFLPTLYENIRAGRRVNDSIPVLDDEDALTDFILLQLSKHDLLEKVGDTYKTRYSRIVPPTKWTLSEGYDYAESLLNFSRDVLLRTKSMQKNVHFGQWSGTLSEADYASLIEDVMRVINSYNDKPNGPIKYQSAFFTKQL